MDPDIKYVVALERTFLQGDYQGMAEDDFRNDPDLDFVSTMIAQNADEVLLREYRFEEEESFKQFLKIVETSLEKRPDSWLTVLSTGIILNYAVVSEVVLDEDGDPEKKTIKTLFPYKTIK